jgi:hypothetical protein
MPRKTNPSFAEVENDIEVDDDLEYTPVVEVSTEGNFINARVKGTWKMFWGGQSYDFVDGKRYKLPKDLYGYLRQSGNIYDTL